MQVGVQVPQIGALAGPEQLRRAIRSADAAGLDSVWVSDHVVFPREQETPYPYAKDGAFPVEMDAPWLEALTTLGFLAAHSDRISLGVSVLVPPLRETLLLAKQLGTLAALAPGRIILGVGVGWLAEEFALLGADFTTRGSHLDEQLQALDRLWSDPEPTFSGQHLSFPPVSMEPRPSPPPQVWVGGTSPAALRRAGRYGDGWHAVGTMAQEELAVAWSAVRAAARDAGRDPSRLALSVRIGARPGDRGLASLRARLEPFHAVGCSHVVVDPVLGSMDEWEGLMTDLHELLEAW